MLCVWCVQAFSASAVGMLIGALAPSSDAALAMFPPIVVLMVIFNGFNISDESTPKALRWIPKTSLIRWAFEGLCLNEFADLEFDCRVGMRGPCAATGAEALNRINIGEKTSLKGAVVAQSKILAGAYLGTYGVLRSQRPRFAKMQVPMTIR